MTRQVLKPNKIAATHREAKKKGWVWVSRFMDGKMKGMWSINTNPLTNAFCRERAKTRTICAQCYSQRMLNGVRRSSVEPFQYNSELLSTILLTSDKLPVINKDIFRFSAHGELKNETHLINYINIASSNSKTIFGLWTKRADLIGYYHSCMPKPSNIIYIHSEPLINNLDPIIPPHFDKVFCVYTKEFIKEHDIEINCKGKKEGGCIKCKHCYSHNNITVIKEKIK